MSGNKEVILIYLFKAQPNYDPNVKHCIYGADADLIHLALISHEAHFYIIRESLDENQWKKCELCGLVNTFIYILLIFSYFNI